MIDSKPLVAIHCLVYNHEPYLRDCFEGFVMQQTNFPFVAIVHDDASTDASAAIIHEYEAKYPHIFKPIYEDENLYQKNGFDTINSVMNTAITATGAKYVAMCEGDDYWTDPLKLQKQVNFMEENEEYSICFHKVSALIQETGELMEEFGVRDMPGTSTILDLAEENYIHTPSVMYRREMLSFDNLTKLLPCLPLDYVVWMLLSEKGKIFKLTETMAIYRYGSGIWSTKQGEYKDINAIRTLCTLWLHFNSNAIRMRLQQQLCNIFYSKNFSLEDINIYKQIEHFYSSSTYRLGNFLIKPFKFIKKALKK